MNKIQRKRKSQGQISCLVIALLHLDMLFTILTVVSFFLIDMGFRDGDFRLTAITGTILALINGVLFGWFLSYVYQYHANKKI